MKNRYYIDFVPQRPSAVKRMKKEKRILTAKTILAAIAGVVYIWVTVWLWYFAIG